MALNKLKFNSLNVTPAASEGIRFNSSANGLETASAGGSLVKIAATTASSSSSISFTSGIDSTYKEYIFFFNNIHPAGSADSLGFTFNASIDGGSNYNVTKTTTFCNSYHYENASGAFLQYSDGTDIAQGTGYQSIAFSAANSDDSISGSLHLFDPSNTTFVKHFVCSLNGVFINSSVSANNFTFPAGYFNTTSAINAVDFKMASGNIDSGTITMYGLT